MTRKQQKKKTVPDDAIAKAMGNTKKDILKLQTGLSKNFVKLASLVADLQRLSPEADVREFLSVECAIDRGEVEALLVLGSIPEDDRDAIKMARPSSSLLFALAGSSEVVRIESLKRMAAGLRLDAGHVTSLGPDLERLSRSRDENVRADRLAALNDKAAGIARTNSALLERQIDELLDTIHEFFEEHIAAPEGWGEYEYHADVESRGYRSGHHQIRSQSSEALRMFERVFGSEHCAPADWQPHMDSSDCLEAGFARAHRALKRFAAGEFGEGYGGFEAEPDKSYPYYFDIWEALVFLSPDVKRIGAPWKDPVTEPPFRLDSLEICAGAGGQTIGLHAAGFDPVALYENDADAVETLRRNWYRWNVVPKDIRSESFTRYRGIDLVAGGIPCQPYTQGGGGLGKLDPRDLLPEAVRIVREAEPRAFFFENVLGFMYGKHSDHRAHALAQFKVLGYDVLIQEIDSRNFGVGQARKRIVIIGFRDGLLRRFTMPEATDWQAAPTVLEDLLMVHRTRPEARPADGETTPGYSEKQKRFDEWADYWLSLYGSKAAPTLAAISKSVQPNTAEAWARAGFAMTGIAAEGPPTPDDLPESDYLDYLPRPTVKMLQRLQDFPDEWSFCGARDSQIQQIVNAFPPSAARSVGQAIYSVLTGVRFDEEKARQSPYRIPATVTYLRPSVTETFDTEPLPTQATRITGIAAH